MDRSYLKWIRFDPGANSLSKELEGTKPATAENDAESDPVQV